MGLIEPSILNCLGFLFNKQITIRQSTQTQDAAGAPVDDWSDLVDHVNIPSVISPANTVSTSTEKRLQDITLDFSSWTVTLKGFFPLIRTGMRAATTSQTYEIVGIQSDSQDIVTSLLVQIPL